MAVSAAAELCPAGPPGTGPPRVRKEGYPSLKSKNQRPLLHRSGPQNVLCSALERGLDLETPSLEQRFGNILRVLVAAGPLAQTSRPQILVGRELVFAHY